MLVVDSWTSTQRHLLSAPEWAAAPPEPIGRRLSLQLVSRMMKCGATVAAVSHVFPTTREPQTPVAVLQSLMAALGHAAEVTLGPSAILPRRSDDMEKGGDGAREGSGRIPTMEAVEGLGLAPVLSRGRGVGSGRPLPSYWS